MLLENEIISRRSELSAAKQALLEKRLLGLGQGTAGKASIPRRSQPASAAPSFAQQRLWFLDQLHPGRPLYNFPIALRLIGPLDRNALEQALAAIVARHESLRTRFASMDGEPLQIISDAASLELPLADLTRAPQATRAAEAERMLAAEAGKPFNLGKDLMIRCLLLKLEPAEHVLMVTMHHIATDAWSVGIFFRELGLLYEAFHGGRASELPELPIHTRISRYGNDSGWPARCWKSNLLTGNKNWVARRNFWICQPTVPGRWADISRRDANPCLTKGTC